MQTVHAKVWRTTHANQGGAFWLAALSILLALALIRVSASADIAGTAMQYDAATKTVTLHLIGAETNANGGFNFNSYSEGAMTITVPTGWKVDGDFIVDSPIPHSVIVTPFDQHDGSGDLTAAFTGAATPQYLNGIAKGDKAQTFSFVADKAGKYALVCGVPGHASAGMWDTFIVSDSATVPTISPAQTATKAPAGNAAAPEAGAHKGGPGFLTGWLLPFILLVVIMVIAGSIAVFFTQRSRRR